MKLLYLSLSYVPSRNASSVHVMKMCAALARAGHDVELVTKRCPPRQEPGVDDPFAFYGVEPGFRLTSLPRPDWRGGGWVWRLGLERLVRRRRGQVDLVYARDPGGAWIAGRLGLPLVVEAHAPPAGKALERHLRLISEPNFRRLVCISDALVERFADAAALPTGDRTLVAHDAADPPPVAPQPGDPGDRPRIGYIGHLYPGRGVELVEELARRLPRCELHLIGGRQEDVERWRQRDAAPNLTFHGFVPPAELERRYRALDILLMPYQRKVGVASGRSDTAGWMSPMKMFEYMAAGRPIISSDLPVLREVLTDGENALLVPPDDPDAWEAAVRCLLADPAESARLGRRAYADLLAHHTWDARARRVLDGL